MKKRIPSPSAASSPLNEDRPRSDAAEEARRRNLLHIGYGRYADPSNPDTVVAKSVNGKLVRVNPSKDDSTKKTSASKDKQQVSRKSAGGKNKQLQKIDTSNTEAFSQPLADSQEEFFVKSEKFRIIDQPFQFSSDLRNSLSSQKKFPVKYIDLLERMAGIEINSETKTIGYFTSDNVGAGRIESQAGELMTMMASTMNDEEADEFFDQLYAITAEASQKTKRLCITESWIKSAQETRYINRARLQLKYGSDVEITHAAWDNENEVEALGLENYKENKGFSTDMYLKVRTGDGKEILNEISLKKDLDVKLFNSSPMRFFDYSKDVPQELNPQVYAKKQLERLNNFGSKYRKKILALAESGNSKELSKELKSKKIDLDKFNSILESGASNRAERKILKVAMGELADQDAGAKKIYEDHMGAAKKYQELAISQFEKNKDMREGLLYDIRKEFPLKLIADGEEDMSLGNISLDETICVELFGTNDFDKIKEHLTVEVDEKGYPYIGYKAETEDKIIPLARIEVREDGIGYGATKIRFDLQLDPGFRKPLKEANLAVYGKPPDFSKTARRAAGKQDVMRDQIESIVREELRAYFKRKMLDMSESDYRKMAMSLIEADEGPFGKSGGGLSKPKSNKPDEKDDETPFDQMQQSMGGGGGAAAGGQQQQQVGSEPNDKEKEMTKDLVKMAKPSIPKAKTSFGKAIIKMAGKEEEPHYPSQRAMNLLDTPENQKKIIKYARNAFKAYGHTKGLRALEARLKDIYEVGDEDVIMVAGAIARMLKADSVPNIDPLRHSPGHRQQFSPYNKGY